MSRARTAAVAVVLAGPAALAFFTGGYLAVSRTWAGVVAWLLVAVAVATVRDPERTGRPARLAFAGLAGLALWELLSTTWAPVAGAAWHAGQITLLYLGVLVAAALLLRGRTRAVEPALAAGVLVVVAYALSDRLLPGLITLDRSISAQGRLEQPLTYWNAMGGLAALGVVLCARLAGDASRSLALRAAATAAAAPIGTALYLTVSRGALFACGAGLLALVVVAGRREQLRGALTVVAVAALAAVATAPFGGVTDYEGSLGARERDGAIVLVLLLVVMAAGAAAQRVLAAEERPGPLLLPRWAPLAAVAIVVGGFALATRARGRRAHRRAADRGRRALRDVHVQPVRVLEGRGEGVRGRPRARRRRRGLGGLVARRAPVPARARTTRTRCMSRRSPSSASSASRCSRCGSAGVALAARDALAIRRRGGGRAGRRRGRVGRPRRRSTGTGRCRR